MRNSIRYSLGTLVLAAAAACSNSSEQTGVSTDLEHDLAKAGGANVQFAGSSAGRIDVVSASERIESPTPSPTAKTTARAPSAVRGNKAVVRSPRRVSPAVAAPAPRAPETAPAEERRAEPEPEWRPAPQPRPRAPVPSTQPEPRGGWRTPGEVIRNAPFPINPSVIFRAGSTASAMRGGRHEPGVPPGRAPDSCPRAIRPRASPRKRG